MKESVSIPRYQGLCDNPSWFVAVHSLDLLSFVLEIGIVWQMKWTLGWRGPGRKKGANEEGLDYPKNWLCLSDVENGIGNRQWAKRSLCNAPKRNYLNKGMNRRRMSVVLPLKNVEMRNWDWDHSSNRIRFGVIKINKMRDRFQRKEHRSPECKVHARGLFSQSLSLKSWANCLFPSFINRRYCARYLKGRFVFQGCCITFFWASCGPKAENL